MSPKKTEPIRVGARVEQEPHGIRVAFTHGEVNERLMGSVTRDQSWMAIDQTTERGHVARTGGGNRVRSEALTVHVG